MRMAERRYGFRFSFAEGCIIVVSILGASLLVFLFGIYAGRELEARKAAEHTSTVRLTALGEGEALSSVKEGQTKLTPVLQTPASPLPNKPTTVVVVSPPRPNESSNTASVSAISPPTSPQGKPLPTNLGMEQKLQAAMANVQSTKTTPFVSPSFPPASHPETPNKNLTLPQGKELGANPNPSQKTPASLFSPKTIPSPA